MTFNGKKTLWRAPELIFIFFLAFQISSYSETQDDPVKFMKKIDSLYYDYKREGLHEFKCQVVVNLEPFFKTKYGPDDPRARAVKNLVYSLEYSGFDNFDATYSGVESTGNFQMDKEIENKIYDDQMAIINFCKTWIQFQSESDFNKYNFTVEKKISSYQITEKNQDGDKAYCVYDNQLVLKEFGSIFVSGKPYKAWIKPEFLKTSNGYLLEGYESSYNDGLLTTQVSITYNFSEKIPLLSIVTIKALESDTNSYGDLIAIFRNYKF